MAQQQQHHYKLVYFSIRGLGEPIRLLLNYAKIDFEDVRIHLEAWPEIKPTAPYEKLPFLVVDTKDKIGSSLAITRFLANRYGLVGKNDIEIAVLDSIADLTNSYFKEIQPFLRIYGNLDEGDKNQSLKDYFIPAIHKYLPYLLIAIKESTSGFFAKSGLTWVDFYVASNIETINNLTPNELQQYPELVKHLHRVYALNELQDYLTHRKDTPI